MPQTSSTSQSKVDINNIVTDLNGKADKDLNNLSTAGLAVLNEKADIDLSNLSTTGKSKLGGSSRNLGEIVSSTLPLTDAGLHLLDGSLIQGGGIYDKFVQYIANLDLSANYFCTETQWQQSVSTYGVCGKFVYDSTNNTVRLPKITGIIEGTTDLNALGELVEAGLPNFEAIFVNHCRDYSVSDKSLTPISGAISVDNNTYPKSTYPNVAGNATGSYNYDQTLKISPSISNSIYGNSSTVQPQTINAFYYIVIATSTKTDVQVDIDNIATDLNGKVNISDLVEVQCIVKTYHNGSSWYRIWSDGWCEQGGHVSSTTGTITLLKPYIDTNYSIFMQKGTTGSNYPIVVLTQTVSNFRVDLGYGGEKSDAWWEAKGYIEV